MTIRWICPALAASLALAVAGCSLPGPKPASTSLLPDYRSALAEKPQDVTVFFRQWLASTPPSEDDGGRLAYSLQGSPTEVTAGVDRLMAAYEAFCSARSGKVTAAREGAGRRCVAADGSAIAGLEVDVVHAAEFQPEQLRFAAQTGEHVQRMEALRRIQRAQLMQTLQGNGPSGDVLLRDGESLPAGRFGRLSGPDYYALQVPGRFLIPLVDVLSVRWADGAMRIVMRDGSVVNETGRTMDPAHTLVRLQPLGRDSVEATAMTFEAPFRFVTADPKSRQPRQVRVRDVSRLLEITVSPRAPTLRAGSLTARPDSREQATFNQALVKDANRAAKKLKSAPAPLDLADPRMRADLERMGRNGPCSNSQSDAALKAGDLSLSEYYVCAQYRREARALLAGKGTITTDKTPLVFLGQTAQAPWFDFGGVLR